jgi:hypothetical protein
VDEAVLGVLCGEFDDPEDEVPVDPVEEELDEESLDDPFEDDDPFGDDDPLDDDSLDGFVDDESDPLAPEPFAPPERESLR